MTDIECPYKVRFEWRTGDTLMNLNAWCQDNCTGQFQYQYTAPIFHFEKSEDAMMFKFQTLLR